MTRPRKLLIFLLILLLLPLIFSNVIQYQEVGDLSFRLLPIDTYPLIGPHMSAYLFWASIFLIFLLIVSFILIAITPKNETDLLVSKSNGSLSIKKSAIENFVLLAISNESWLKKPRIKIKMKKDKIKIKISADCPTSETNIMTKTTDLTLRVKQELLSILGLEAEKHINVEIKQFPKEKNDTSRVV